MIGSCVINVIKTKLPHAISYEYNTKSSIHKHKREKKEEHILIKAHPARTHWLGQVDHVSAPLGVTLFILSILAILDEFFKSGCLYDIGGSAVTDLCFTERYQPMLVSSSS